MSKLIPQSERLSKVAYAIAPDGRELPVIDVTHECFDEAAELLNLPAIRRKARLDTDAWLRKPAWVRHLLVGLLARKSSLLAGLHRSRGAYVTGLDTYLLKLPPGALASSFSAPFDRRFAATESAKDLRFRVRLMAEMLSSVIREGLIRADATQARRAPLALLNLAGGPAMDSINCLILVAREQAELLRNRELSIEVLDLMKDAPAFGASAVAALKSPGYPLAEVDLRFSHHSYDWRHPESLQDFFKQLGPDCIVHGSSEGGLLHYAEDEVMEANLRALHQYSPPDFTFTASFSPDTPESRAFLSVTRAKVRCHHEDAPLALAERCGFHLRRREEAVRTVCLQFSKDASFRASRFSGDHSETQLQGA